MKGPFNDLVALLPQAEKEEEGERTYTPDTAKLLKTGKVLSIGTPSFPVQGGTITKEIEVGENVLYWKSAEDRREKPAVRHKMPDGQEVLFISYLDLLTGL